VKRFAHRRAPNPKSLAEQRFRNDGAKREARGRDFFLELSVRPLGQSLREVSLELDPVEPVASYAGPTGPAGTGMAIDPRDFVNLRDRAKEGVVPVAGMTATVQIERGGNPAIPGSGANRLKGRR
jgi:hypothetical protein